MTRSRGWAGRGRGRSRTRRRRGPSRFGRLGPKGRTRNRVRSAPTLSARQLTAPAASDDTAAVIAPSPPTTRTGALGSAPVRRGWRRAAGRDPRGSAASRSAPQPARPRASRDSSNRSRPRPIQPLPLPQGALDAVRTRTGLWRRRCLIRTRRTAPLCDVLKLLGRNSLAEGSHASIHGPLRAFVAARSVQESTVRLRCHGLVSR